MKILVTGANGFVGAAVAARLVARGDVVRGFSRGVGDTGGVEFMRGDLADRDRVFRAVKGCDAVVHVAAKTGPFGLRRAFYRANVQGTEHIIDACRTHGVRTLVYTSSPSVVFDGGDLEGIDESRAYARHFEAAYPKTKAIAERLVLAVDGPDLHTVALRPHLIWGPGDRHLVPRILERGARGRLRRVGRTSKRVSVTYIDDAARAHVLALDRLSAGGVEAERIRGKPYFITSGEPIELWAMIDAVLAAGGLPPVTKTVPARVAYAIGAALEAFHWLARRDREPLMTRWIARELSTSHWFDISAARRDLGYQPEVTLSEGMARLAASLDTSSTDRPPS